MSLTEYVEVVNEFSIEGSIIEVPGENGEIEFAGKCPVCDTGHYNRRWSGCFNAVGQCLNTHRQHVERNPANVNDLEYILL
jgi:hypothetical protein